LSIAFSGKANQINEGALLKLETDFGFGCKLAARDKTPALPPKPQYSSRLRLSELGPFIISDEVKAI